MANTPQKEIPFDGFNRILVDAEGTAMSMKRAFDLGVEPDVGFMRKDGWTLGAPKHLEKEARRMWEGEWTHEIHYPEAFWKKIL